MTEHEHIVPFTDENNQHGSYSRKAFLEKFGPFLYSDMPIESDYPAELNKAMYRRVYRGLKTLEAWGVVKLDPKPKSATQIGEVTDDVLYELEYRLAECFVAGASSYMFAISGKQVTGEELNDLLDSFKNFSKPKQAESLPENPKFIP